MPASMLEAVVRKEDDLRARLIALSRALDAAAVIGRAAVEKGERDYSSDVLDRLEDAVREAMHELVGARRVDGRSALLDEAETILMGAFPDADAGAAPRMVEKAEREFRALLRMGGSVTARTVTLASRLLYSSRRALGRHMLMCGYPAPKYALAWGRLLVAMHLYSVEGMTLAECARRMGYTDPFSLSNHLVRLAHVRPDTMRQSGLPVMDLCYRFVEVWCEEEPEPMPSRGRWSVSREREKSDLEVPRRSVPARRPGDPSAERPCRGCGDPFTQTLKQGRPYSFCPTCRPRGGARLS